MERFFHNVNRASTGRLAQLVERRPYKADATSSSLVPPTSQFRDLRMSIRRSLFLSQRTGPHSVKPPPARCLLSFTRSFLPFMDTSSSCTQEKPHPYRKQSPSLLVICAPDSAPNSKFFPILTTFSPCRDEKGSLSIAVTICWAYGRKPTGSHLIYCPFHSSSMFRQGRHFCLYHRRQVAVVDDHITQGVPMSSDSSIPLSTVSLYSLR